ncbi:MAG: RNA 2',3'-cyclic phosphodiesterase [Nanoarchaeota archaeon]
MRAFIAVELPREAGLELISIQKDIDKLGLIKGKFTDEETFHLTLKFLGELSRSEIDAVKDRLKNIKFKPFELEIDRLGVFSEEFIRIIWVSFKSEAIFNLQKQIDEALEDLFPKEHSFMAHITIARPKFIEDKKVFLEELGKINFKREKFQVNEFSLKKSDLTPQGAKYSDIEKINGIHEISVSV